MVFCLILITYTEHAYLHINLPVPGIAYLSRVCNSYAASVNEETFNAIAIHIGAHELGHRYCCICFFKSYNEKEISSE